MSNICDSLDTCLPAGVRVMEESRILSLEVILELEEKGSFTVQSRIEANELVTIR